MMRSAVTLATTMLLVSGVSLLSGCGNQSGTVARVEDVPEDGVVVGAPETTSTTLLTTTSTTAAPPTTSAPPPTTVSPDCAKRFFATYATRIGDQFSLDQHRCHKDWAGATYLNELSGSVFLVVFKARDGQWVVFDSTNMAHRSTAEWVAMGVPKQVVGSFIDQGGGLDS